MDKDSIGEYNKFCKNVTEGTILYNIDSTNLWGDYLLVANKCTVSFNGMTTYTLLLIGLKRKDGKMHVRDLKINLTPDYAAYIPFLKYVGKCQYLLVPELYNVDISLALVAVYENTDIWKSSHKASAKKPRRRKYDKDGKPVLKSIKNNN